MRSAAAQNPTATAKTGSTNLEAWDVSGVRNGVGWGDERTWRLARVGGLSGWPLRVGDADSEE